MSELPAAEAAQEVGRAAEEAVPNLLPSARPRPRYVLARGLFLRLLGGVYFFAFLSLARQLLPLLGAHGLQPAALFLDRVAQARGSRLAGFFELPSLFWLASGDAVMQAAAWLGVTLAGAVALGAGNAVLLLVLWALYLSFVHVGQLFYGFGWEALTLETGFLAIFLCPLRALRPGSMEPPRAVIFLLRWVLFRVILGAGLIKIRGDGCWRDLTCLYYHYETQPLPNPLSWLLHQSPPWFHRGEVLWNHVVELIAPWFLFVPQRAARIAGLLQIGFQLTLIASGNLSWLNWLTLALGVACLDDDLLLRLSPASLQARLQGAIAGARVSTANRRMAFVLAIGIGVLSVSPVANMLSSRQVMNTGFDPLELVNTYGAFGSVGRHRPEVILEGTADEVVTDATVWREYEFPCKPGDPRRRPCVIAPYQPRLDWEIWFAAMSDYQHHPWLIRLVDKLLRGDRAVSRLLAVDPFPGRPPRYIRARLFEYEFTRLGDGSGAWWKRRFVETYFDPVSLADPTLAEFLAEHGYPEE